MVAPGVNLPWIHYGGDFGANAWSPSGGLTSRADPTLHRRLDEAASAGAELVRWFVLTDGRAGLTFDDADVPVTLQPVVLDDMAAALDALQSHGLRMVPVLFDFTWADAARVVDGVRLGGRMPVLRDALARHALWQAVDALVRPFRDHPGIAMWDLWNEPDWMTAASRPWSRRMTPRALRQCLAELALHVRWHTTHPLTVGLSCTRGLPLCRDLELDVLQVHWYDDLEPHSPLAQRPHVPWSEAPWLLGEFPTRGSARSPAEIVGIALDAGYVGAWPWSLHAGDRSSDADETRQILAALRARPRR